MASTMSLSMHQSPVNTYRVLLPLAAAVDGLILWWLVQTHGWNETSALLFTRYSARVSFMFFLPVFVASSLQVLAPSRLSADLLKRRRQWALSFVFAHTLHMFGIMAHYRMRGEWFTADDIPALVIYLFIYLMALTSNNWSVRRLGKAWKVLHKLGIYAVFTGFAVTYSGRLGSSQVSLDASEPAHEWYVVYLLLAVLVNLGLLLRIAAFWKKRLSS